MPAEALETARREVTLVPRRSGVRRGNGRCGGGFEGRGGAAGPAVAGNTPTDTSLSAAWDRKAERFGSKRQREQREQRRERERERDQKWRREHQMAARTLIFGDAVAPEGA